MKLPPTGGGFRATKSAPGAVIAQKRDGQVLTAAEIQTFIAGLASREVGDAEAGAFAMAVLLRGMAPEERAGLTLAMRDSGTVLSWDLPGPVVDKHSTGGLGDNVSLILAPALAACGCYVPMISGRALGHTGGTLDKLESIPGYQTVVSEETLRRVLGETGVAIVGASAEIAPADRRLYEIRDRCAAVESLDLIVSSILSKKLAAGLEALVLDVKCGSGAFMKTREDARNLAEALVETSCAAGCPAAALITSMDIPLAPVAGNALEARCAIDFLTGAYAAPANHRLLEVVLALGGEALRLCSQTEDRAEGEERIQQVLASGQAAERFGRMAAALGGPKDLLEKAAAILPQAAIVREIPAQREGILTAVDGEAIGRSLIELASWQNQKRKADPSTGIEWLAPLGTALSPATALAKVHAASEEGAARAAEAIKGACVVDPQTSL